MPSTPRATSSPWTLTPPHRQRRRGRPRRPHSRRRPTRRIEKRLPGRATPRPARRDSHAGTDQHAHARRHVAAARHRRRPHAARLARKIYLPRRIEKRHAGFRALGNAPGVPRDDALRHDHLRRHVLLRRPRRAGHQRSRHAWHSRRDNHRLSGPRRQDPGRFVALHRALHPAVQERPADCARRRAALHLHQQRCAICAPRACSRIATAFRL